MAKRNKIDKKVAPPIGEGDIQGGRVGRIEKALRSPE